MKVFFALFLVWLSGALVCAQVAPGDEDGTCMNRVDAYPSNIKMLMSSLHYLDLIGNGGVWDAEDFDTNNSPNRFYYTNWIHSIGGTCRRNVKACGSRRGRQDNWLFTQFISKTVPSNTQHTVKVIANISYTITACRERYGCNPQISVLSFVTDGPQPREVYTNKTIYELIAHASGMTRRVTTIMAEVEIPVSDGGFYLAVRDNSSCIQISKIEVFRYQCVTKQEGLVIFPATAAPVENTMTVMAQCMPNSSPIESVAVNCSSEGQWEGSSRCRCDAGYYRIFNGDINHDYCKPCPEGLYRSHSDPEERCLPCPANTIRDIMAASGCECNPGYFRNTEGLNDSCPAGQITEDVSYNCTRPTSEPLNLFLANSTSTSLTVNWTAPEYDGGRNDLYFTVHYSDPDYVGETIEANCLENFNECIIDYECTITDLQAATRYVVWVSSHNGVSDQDEGRSETRTAEIIISTNFGPPSAVESLLAFCEVVVWQPPHITSGELSHYLLLFNYTNGTVLDFVVEQHFFTLAQFYEPWASVKVAAINQVGPGPFVEVILPDCLIAIPDPPDPRAVVLTVTQTSTVVTTQIPMPTSVFVTIPTTVINTETVTEQITATTTAVVTSTVVSTAAAPTPSPVIVEVPTTVTTTGTITETSVATTTKTTTAVTTTTVEPSPVLVPVPTTIVSTAIETEYITRTETESLTLMTITTVLAEPSPVYVTVPTTVIVTSTETDHVTATTTTFVTTTTTRLPEPTQCPEACDSCCEECEECDCTVPPPVPSPEPMSCPPCPTFPSFFAMNCARRDRTPGNVRNVHLLKCGLLVWDAPEDPNCCKDTLTYKVRIYSGSSFNQRDRVSNKVMSVPYTWIKLSSYNLPPGRPLKVMVKARNQNGAHSAKWVVSEPITDSYVVDCPSFD